MAELIWGLSFSDSRVSLLQELARKNPDNIVVQVYGSGETPERIRFAFTTQLSAQVLKESIARANTTTGGIMEFIQQQYPQT